MTVPGKSDRAYALTSPQLMNQALEQGLVLNDLKLIKKAYQQSEIMFDGCYRAQSMPFVCHLVRSASIVLDERQPVAAVAASLLHAAYLTGQFRDGCCGGAEENHRREIRNAVGEEIENLVYAYNQLPWYSADTINIYTRDIDSMSEEKRRIIVMRLADLLEDYLDMGFVYRGKELYSEKIESYSRAGLALAKVLGLSRLVKELECMYELHLKTKIPMELTTGRCELYRHSEQSFFIKDTFKKIKSLIKKAKAVKQTLKRRSK